MKNNVNVEFQVLVFIGAIFSFLGALFTIIAIGVYSTESVMDEGTVGFVAMFFGVGLFFFVLGVFFLGYELRKKLSQNALVKNGYCIYATITGIEENLSVTINGEHPYVVIAEYEDPYSGEKHIFRSKDIRNFPHETLGNCVKVYMKQGQYEKYYMDIDSQRGI